ncbi:hypothetical protein [Streptomyces solaniscabiei]|nr:hypothetical protein [Streptomyces solaniscabiei]
MNQRPSDFRPFTAVRPMVAARPRVSARPGEDLAARPFTAVAARP